MKVWIVTETTVSRVEAETAEAAEEAFLCNPSLYFESVHEREIELERELPNEGNTR